MGPPRALGEAFDPRARGIDDQRRARIERADRFGGEAEIEQGDALAGGRHERPLDRVLHRADAEGITGNDHPPAGIDHRDVPGPVKPPGDRREQFDGRWDDVPRELPTDGMEDYLGVVVAGEVVVAIGEDLSPQFGVIGQLAIKSEGEPLPLLDVGALQWLGVAAILGPAGRIADMADRRRTGVLIHEPVIDAPVAHPEHLAHTPDIFVGGEKLIAIGIPGRHSGRELAAILDVEEHPGHEPGHVVGTLHRAQRAGRAPGEVIDSRQAALVMEFSHHIACMQAPERLPNTRQQPCRRTKRWPCRTGQAPTLPHRTGSAQSSPTAPLSGGEKTSPGRSWKGLGSRWGLFFSRW